MRGIPWTQALAAVFFLSSTVNLLRTLCIRVPQAEISSPVGTVQACLLLGAFHTAGMLALFYELADNIGIGAPENVAHTVNWIIQMSLLVCNAYLIQHVFFIVIDVKQPVSHT